MVSTSICRSAVAALFFGLLWAAYSQGANAQVIGSGLGPQIAKTIAAVEEARRENKNFSADVENARNAYFACRPDCEDDTLKKDYLYWLERKDLYYLLHGIEGEAFGQQYVNDTLAIVGLVDNGTPGVCNSTFNPWVSSVYDSMGRRLPIPWDRLPEAVEARASDYAKYVACRDDFETLVFNAKKEAEQPRGPVTPPLPVFGDPGAYLEDDDKLICKFADGTSAIFAGSNASGKTQCMTQFRNRDPMWVSKELDIEKGLAHCLYTDGFVRTYRRSTTSSSWERTDTYVGCAAMWSDMERLKMREWYVEEVDKYQLNIGR